MQAHVVNSIKWGLLNIFIARITSYVALSSASEASFFKEHSLFSDVGRNAIVKRAVMLKRLLLYQPRWHTDI